MMIKAPRHESVYYEKTGKKKGDFHIMVKSPMNTPRPGFEPGHPCGNKLSCTKLSRLAQYQVVPPRQTFTKFDQRLFQCCQTAYDSTISSDDFAKANVVLACFSQVFSIRKKAASGCATAADF
jgi:hypothetical protein